MRCGQVRNRLVALTDGEVAPSERIQLLEHLDSCEACRALYDRYLAVLPTPELHVPPEVGNRLWQQVRATPILALVRERGPAVLDESARAAGTWLSADAGVTRGALLLYGGVLGSRWRQRWRRGCLPAWRA